MSRPTPVPITPSVLSWAIEQSGYQLTELASAIDVTPVEIEQWLSGASVPTISVARNLANKLHRPLATFLLPSPPKSEPLQVEFRHSLQDRVSPNPNERRYLRRAKRFQQTLSWLVRELRADKPVVPPRTLDSNPGPAAEIARKSLGVSADEQKGWSTTAVAFDNWRLALERIGLSVFLFSMGKDSCRGFSLWDEFAPVIAVNTAWNEAARVFTLFHELGHLVTRTSSACLESGRNKDDQVERWCERFSAHLLMPTNDVYSTLTEYGWKRDTLVGDLAVAGRIATCYKVSLRAATIRLIDLNVADWNLYDQIPPVSDKKKQGGGGTGRDRTEIREDELGDRTTSLLVKAVERDLLDRSQAVELLDIPDAKFDDLQTLEKAG
jgi:Zn-dependent peptidase ImmA (M78 family)/transcriptional regulator with XRE-family HTH domain